MEGVDHVNNLINRSTTKGYVTIIRDVYVRGLDTITYDSVVKQSGIHIYCLCLPTQSEEIQFKGRCNRMFDQNGLFIQLLNRKQLLNMNIIYDELIKSSEHEYWKAINQYRNKYEEVDYKKLKENDVQLETNINMIETKYKY